MLKNLACLVSLCNSIWPLWPVVQFVHELLNIWFVSIVNWPDVQFFRELLKTWLVFIVNWPDVQFFSWIAENLIGFHCELACCAIFSCIAEKSRDWIKSKSFIEKPAFLLMCEIGLYCNWELPMLADMIILLKLSILYFWFCKVGEKTTKWKIRKDDALSQLFHMYHYLCRIKFLYLETHLLSIFNKMMRIDQNRCLLFSFSVQGLSWYILSFFRVDM